MSKKTFGAKTMLYPMPSFLIGADVEGKPNFLTAAWASIACGEPPMVCVAIRESRYTMKGIRENEAFSVNVPISEMAVKTDYCGIVSGKKDDKTVTCGFNVFYGKTEKAPLIDECPVNLECTLEKLVELGSHTLVIGRIKETHVSEHCLTDGKPDAAKIDPLIYSPSGKHGEYYSLGRYIDEAFSCGKALK